MAESWVIQGTIGILLGFLAGLGTGGGSLLMVWLVTILDTPAEDARIINLLFFIPCALIASIYRWKQNCLSLRTVLPGACAGCISAGAAFLFFQNMNSGSLQILFGIFLIMAGIREIFYRPRKAR